MVIGVMQWWEFDSKLCPMISTLHWERQPSPGLSHSWTPCWACQECASLWSLFFRWLSPISEFLIYWVWARAPKCAFLINSSVILRVLVRELYFENHFNTVPMNNGSQTVLCMQKLKNKTCMLNVMEHWMIVILLIFFKEKENIYTNVRKRNDLRKGDVEA